MVKGKVFRASCCFIVEALFCASNDFFVCSVIFWTKMTCLRLGISAKVSILVSRLHLKNLISKAYANYTKTNKAEGLVVVSEGPKSIRREEKVVVIFRHPPNGNLMEEFECWAIHCFTHIMEEGNEEDVFTSSSDGGSNNSGGVGVAQPNPNIMQNPTQHNPEDAQTIETVPTEVVQLFESNSSTLDSNNANLVWQILPGMVDDDNQPLPENIPTPAEEGQDAPQFFSTWEHSGDCYHCLAGGRKHKACLSLYTDVKPTIQQMFKMFFFKQCVEGIIIPQTIYTCEKKDCPVSYGEFLLWLGLWFLMATINGPDRPDFRSMGEDDCFIHAPLRLGSFMSRKRFEAILKALAITARQPSAFRDHFWEVQEIIEAWNANMTEQFTPSWVSCLDESMSPWTNKYSCPGWMFVPRKLWPFGNEYHTVCYSLSGILWQMELVEGKDSPSEIIPKYNNKGKTVGLLLRVLEPIFTRGNVVILDSGFCVLK